MWYPADNFACVGQEIFCLEECNAVGDFYDLCLFRVYKETHVSCDALDVFTQTLEILFIGMQDDPVVHVRIVAMQPLDGLAVRVDTCREENPCDLRQR